MCLHMCVGTTVKHMHMWHNFSRKGRVWAVRRWRNKSEGVKGDKCAHTHTQMCYWRCKKNQCSAGKAFPLLVQGVRLLSVAFNYSFSSRPAEPHWFSFSPPPSTQRRRQIERLDLSIQNNPGRGNTDNSQSYFNGVLQKQSQNSPRSKFHSEGEQSCVKNTLWEETPEAMHEKFTFSKIYDWDGNAKFFLTCSQLVFNSFYLLNSQWHLGLVYTFTYQGWQCRQ